MASSSLALAGRSYVLLLRSTSRASRAVADTPNLPRLPPVVTSQLLLPFSLSSGAVGGYSNPSLIAMLAVGCVLLIAYVGYERFFARFPTAPLRLLKNKTFVMASESLSTRAPLASDR